MKSLLVRSLVWIANALLWLIDIILCTLDPKGKYRPVIESPESDVYNGIPVLTASPAATTVAGHRVSFDVNGKECQVDVGELDLPESFGSIRMNESGDVALTATQREVLGDAILKHVGHEYHMALLEQSTENNLPWPAVFCSTAVLWGQNGVYDGSLGESQGRIVSYGIN